MSPKSYHLIGDGLAASFLAMIFQGSKTKFLQYGDNQANTPPLGFVHLFQGRTFHRDPIEITAFSNCTAYWRNEELATEWLVRRSVKPGDRLSKSSQTKTVPELFRPRQIYEQVFEYGPGFTIQANELVQRARVLCSEHIITQRVNSSNLSGIKVHAIGLDVKELLPKTPWDINPGRTVKAHCPDSPQTKPKYISLLHGCHLGSSLNQPGFTIGGRVNSKGEAKNDEAELASQILGHKVTLKSEWWGQRIANAVDRWPLLGWIDRENFLFAGFGGRALFWLPYCSQIAIQALKSENNDPIPPKLRADRFTKL